MIAVTPAWSPDHPDSLVITAGRGKRVSKFLGAVDSSKVIGVTTHTFDPALTATAMKPIANYTDPPFTVTGYGVDPIPSPVLSPDGTRLMLGVRQIWAARRNMSLPPKFTSTTSTNEGTRTVADTLAMEKFVVYVDQLGTITVAASDPPPENDALRYHAAFWQSLPWMVWDPNTQTLTLVAPPPSAVGYHYVKFWATTTSGGTDALIGRIQVAPLGGAMSSSFEGASAGAKKAPDGPNPTHGRFALTAPFVRGVSARLAVFDLSGRLVKTVRGPSGSQLIWDGRNRPGALVSPGIYLYRMWVGKEHKDGKIVVMR